jgi:VanZ family protein
MMPLVMWLAAIFALSIYPSERPDPIIPNADKLLHVIIYAITSLLIYTYLSKSDSAAVRERAITLSIIIASVYGLFMEIAQSQMSTRVFSLEDEVANVLGAIAGMVFLRLTKKKTQAGPKQK